MSRETFDKLPSEKKETIAAAGIGLFSRGAYSDVSTESITKACRISKGILFHYFGSKKEYYLYCLEQSMERLTQKSEEAGGSDFYEILFAEMDRKMALCTEFGDEMRMVNMASRDASAEIALPKAELLGRYAAAVHAESARTLRKALAALPFFDESIKPSAEEGLRLYIQALLNRYLLQYQREPDRFFENREAIKKEMKGYLDLMLYGIRG